MFWKLIVVLGVFLVVISMVVVAYQEKGQVKQPIRSHFSAFTCTAISVPVLVITHPISFVIGTLQLAKKVITTPRNNNNI